MTLTKDCHIKRCGGAEDKIVIHAAFGDIFSVSKCVVLGLNQVSLVKITEDITCKKSHNTQVLQSR